MTEQEAKEKWCPMVRAAMGVDDNNAANAGCKPEERVLSYSLCVASACMMWRWIGEVGLCEGDHEGATGYCGLGGRP